MPQKTLSPRSAVPTLAWLGLLTAGCGLGFADAPVLPAELTYATNPAVYLVGVEIPPNLPSSTGGAVDAYAVWPALPDALSLDAATGAISGTPQALTTTAAFTVTATNAAGSTSVVLNITINPAVTVPAAPSAVLAVADLRSARVSWTAPADTGGAALTGFLVLIFPAAPDAVVTVEGTTALVTGLADGTSYSFTAAASNSVGTGPASAPSPPVSTPGLPGEIGGLAALPGNGWVSLSWTAPGLDGGRPVTGYAVTISPATPSALIDVAGTSATVSGLTNGTAYTFQVAAVTEVGTGPAGAPSAVVVPAVDACAVDAHCAGEGWCQAGLCQPPYGLVVASGLTPADDGRVYASGSLPLGVGISGGSPLAVEVLLVGIGRLQVVGPPAYTFSWDTMTVAQGSYQLVASAEAGTRTYRSPALDVMVDRTPPAPPTLDPLPAGAGTGVFALTGAAEPRSTLTVLSDDVPIAQLAVAAGGAWSVPLTLPPGAHTLTATARDLAGNVSAASPPAPLVVEQAGPG